ncbi:MAG: hypothetical protein ACOX9B_15120 [Candidatus Xenobium sp.]|jgi:hypothetical protein|nr:hypothetical protein [Burkholderiales bacterium]
MTFWEELRIQVRERTTAGDISYELFDLITATGVSEVAVVQPTFYMGRFFILTHDFMDFTEKLLDTPADPGHIFSAVLYLRETARTMSRMIRRAAEPVEGMMQYLDLVYEESLGPDSEEEEEVHEHDHAEEEDEFAAERDALRQSLKVKLREARLSDKVVEELSKRLADTYHGCVRFARALRLLKTRDPEVDLPGFLTVLVDIQYVMDMLLRRLLVEDVFLDETPAFTTGLMPWISHAIEELAQQITQTQVPPSTESASD